MSDPLGALEEAYEIAKTYRRSVGNRPCTPQKSYGEMRTVFDEAVPETGMDGPDVIRELSERGEAGLMQMAHPRFFG